MRVLMTSSGDEISRSIILSLLKLGARLVLLGEEPYLQRIVGEITDCLKIPAEIKVIALDMQADDEGIFDEAVHKAFTYLGFIDAFVNCYLYEGRIQEALNTSAEEFKKIVKINFSAVWFLVKAVSSRMRCMDTGGSIVLVTSINGAERGLYPGSAAYGSCMAGVEQLVRLWALEMGKYKIRVNAIARGLHLNDQFPRFIGKERAEKLTKIVMPLSRWLDVKKDLVSTVVYLVGDDSCYMTGTIVLVDGAQSLVRPRMKSFM